MLRSVALLLTLIISLNTQADDQARLDQIKAEIKKLQSWLTDAREEHDELQQRLRKSDQEIAAQIKKSRFWFCETSLIKPFACEFEI